jgi:serine/threonine-protein kinase SRPK3
MMELLGPMPKSMALSGVKYNKMFDRSGQLKRIRGLNFWPLHKVLHEKYRMKESEAKAFADFLMPMLDWDPEDRASS